MTQVKEAVRSILPKDEAALARFFCANNTEETRLHFHPFALDGESASRIANYFGRDAYFAAFVDGEIAGFGMLRGWDEGFAISSFGVLVDRQYRGRGLGRELTLHAIANGGECVRLTVSPENMRARSLYKGLGFEETETLADGRLVMHRKQPPK